MSNLIFFLVLTSLWLVQIVDVSLAVEDCDVWYLREPFPVIQCNPYSGDAQDFDLQCKVQAPAYLGSRVQILWFFTNRDQQTVSINMTTLSSLVSIVSENETRNGKLLLTSTITFGRFSDPIHAGSYFCQVALDGSTDIFLRSEMQTFDEETAQVLSSHPCGTRMESHSQNVMKCAGNISTSTTSVKYVESTTSIEPTVSVTTSGPTPSSPQPTPTTSSATLGNTIRVTTDSQSQTGRPGLSLWVYVLVGVAAVFGMIIIVLTILCIGLCLKKNKTTDSFKHKTPELKEFSSGSMVTNGLYQRKEDDFTSGTHQSSHLQIADYNTLGERDYEIVDVNECKRDYNHLHRPSPPVVPGGRNGTFVFSPSKEFHSMSTLTSQQGLRGGNKGGNGSRGAGSKQGAAMQHGMMSPAAGPGMFPPKSASVEPEGHVYRELEQQARAADSSRLPSTSHLGNAATLPSIYRSPTGSAPPDSARSFNKEFHPDGIDCIDEGNGSDMFPAQPNFNFVQPAGLQNKPETGNMFTEPANPTSFPVHNYEKVVGEAEYETPIVTRKAKPATPTSAPPPPLPGRSSQTSMRGRSDSGARYETELAQNFGENSGHYHKLVRNSGDHSSNSRVTSRQEFSEDNATDITSVMDDEVMTMDGTLTMDSTLNGRERNLAAFENPMSNSTRGSFQEEKGRFPGTTIYDPRSSSSATGSLSSYIDQLQADEEDEEPISDVLFDDVVASMSAMPDRMTVSLSREGERPMEMQNGCWKDGHGHSSRADGSLYSRLSMDPGSTTAEERQPPLHVLPPKMCRDIQNNGVGYGLNDCTRLKTVV